MTVHAAIKNQHRHQYIVTANVVCKTLQLLTFCVRILSRLTRSQFSRASPYHILTNFTQWHHFVIYIGPTIRMRTVQGSSRMGTHGNAVPVLFLYNGNVVLASIRKTIKNVHQQ